MAVKKFATQMKLEQKFLQIERRRKMRGEANEKRRWRMKANVAPVVVDNKRASIIAGSFLTMDETQSCWAAALPDTTPPNGTAGWDTWQPPGWLLCRPLPRIPSPLPRIQPRQITRRGVVYVSSPRQMRRRGVLLPEGTLFSITDQGWKIKIIINREFGHLLP